MVLHENQWIVMNSSWYLLGEKYHMVGKYDDVRKNGHKTTVVESTLLGILINSVRENIQRWYLTDTLWRLMNSVKRSWYLLGEKYHMVGKYDDVRKNGHKTKVVESNLVRDIEQLH